MMSAWPGLLWNAIHDGNPIPEYEVIDLVRQAASEGLVLDSLDRAARW